MKSQKVGDLTRTKHCLNLGSEKFSRIRYTLTIITGTMAPAWPQEPQVIVYLICRGLCVWYSGSFDSEADSY